MWVLDAIILYVGAYMVGQRLLLRVDNFATVMVDRHVMCQKFPNFV